MLSSFHVGSGCQTPSAYQAALELAADVFRYGAALGYHFSLLDIGGGFPGTKDSGELLHQVATSIKKGLECYFGSYPNLRVIAEPGRPEVGSWLQTPAEFNLRVIAEPGRPEVGSWLQTPAEFI